MKNNDNAKCSDKNCPATDQVGGHTKGISVHGNGQSTDCSGKGK
jgi:hypothetical protein